LKIERRGQSSPRLYSSLFANVAVIPNCDPARPI
jgi:hypothetical protein